MQKNRLRAQGALLGRALIYKLFCDLSTEYY
jgi:hypothetical protein